MLDAIHANPRDHETIQDAAWECARAQRLWWECLYPDSPVDMDQASNWLLRMDFFMERAYGSLKHLTPIFPGGMFRPADVTDALLRAEEMKMELLDVLRRGYPDVGKEG